MTEVTVRREADAIEAILTLDVASFANQKSILLEIARKRRKSRRRMEIEVDRRIVTRPLKCIAPVAAEVASPNDSSAETPATEAPKAELLLNIDFGNLVTEMVSCCDVEVCAVIDNGTGISIVPPALPDKLSSPKRP